MVTTTTTTATIDTINTYVCSWHASRDGYKATSKPASCQEYIMFVNIVQVGNVDLCLDDDSLAKGMIHSALTV